jgi:hypothetical protein
MKRTLLLFGVSMFAIASSFAQNKISYTGGNGANIASSTILVEIENTDNILIDLDVTNISGATVNSIVSRTIVNGPAAWSDEVCYGQGSNGGCYTPTTTTWSMNSGDAITLNDQGVALANIKIHPATLQNGTYRYYVGTPNDPYQDSVDVEITSVASIKEVKKVLTLSVSPNPATENFTVKAPGVDKASIKVVDVLGNVILNESFTGYKNVNVNEFKNGIYFVIISGDGMTPLNRKVVVRH